MPWPSRKRMTAKTTTNRNCPIPNEGGSPPAEAVVFIEINLHHKVASHLVGAQRPTLIRPDPRKHLLVVPNFGDKIRASDGEEGTFYWRCGPIVACSSRTACIR